MNLFHGKFHISCFIFKCLTVIWNMSLLHFDFIKNPSRNRSFYKHFDVFPFSSNVSIQFFRSNLWNQTVFHSTARECSKSKPFQNAPRKSFKLIKLAKILRLISAKASKLRREKSHLQLHLCKQTICSVNF